ncbi:MAG: hypothetical protein WAK93_21870 [Solirubrobacteraceae bacterium]
MIPTDLPPTPADAKALGAERLRQRRLRVRMIRRRIAGLATATFLATSAGIAIQLVTGNDPALASKAKTSGSSGSSSVSPSVSPSSSLSPVTSSAS